MKKTEDGKKVRVVLLEICSIFATSKKIEQQNFEMLKSSIAKLSADLMQQENAKNVCLKAGENMFCVKLRKLSAEHRVIEMIGRFNFKIVCRKLAQKLILISMLFLFNMPNALHGRMTIDNNLKRTSKAFNNGV